MPHPLITGGGTALPTRDHAGEGIAPGRPGKPVATLAEPF